MTLALPILVLLLASCAVPTPPTCQGDPIASGTIVQISQYGAQLCQYGVGGTSIISDQATYDDFADKCLGTWGAPPELPPVDFTTQEVVVRSTQVGCPLDEVLEGAECVDGVLYATSSYVGQWCSCHWSSSSPLAFVAPKGYITEVVGTWAPREDCHDVTCDCGDWVDDGCEGCSYR